ncbi:unnamed protein product [Urochloa humidicola]
MLSLLPPPPTPSSPTPRVRLLRVHLRAQRSEQLRLRASARWILTGGGASVPGLRDMAERLLLRLPFLLWPPRGPFLRRTPPGSHGRPRCQIPAAVSSSARELRRDAPSAGKLLPPFRCGVASSPRARWPRPSPEPSGGAGLHAVHSLEGRRGGSAATARRAGAASVSSTSKIPVGATTLEQLARSSPK